MSEANTVVLTIDDYEKYKKMEGALANESISVEYTRKAQYLDRADYGYKWHSYIGKNEVILAMQRELDEVRSELEKFKNPPPPPPPIPPKPKISYRKRINILFTGRI